MVRKRLEQKGLDELEADLLRITIRSGYIKYLIDVLKGRV